MRHSEHEMHLQVIKALFATSNAHQLYVWICLDGFESKETRATESATFNPSSLELFRLSLELAHSL